MVKDLKIFTSHICIQTQLLQLWDEWRFSALWKLLTVAYIWTKLSVWSWRICSAISLRVYLYMYQGLFYKLREKGHFWGHSRKLFISKTWTVENKSAKLVRNLY